MNYPIQASDLENAKRHAPYRASALNALTNWHRTSGSARRIAKRATFQTLLLFPDKPVRREIKLALKLQSLPLVKVFRRQRQFARRASTALHLLRKMAEKSPFRPGMEDAHRNWIGAFKQATAEIKARALTAEGVQLC